MRGVAFLAAKYQLLWKKKSRKKLFPGDSIRSIDSLIFHPKDLHPTYLKNKKIVHSLAIKIVLAFPARTFEDQGY